MKLNKRSASGRAGGASRKGRVSIYYKERERERAADRRQGCFIKNAHFANSRFLNEPQCQNEYPSTFDGRNPLLNPSEVLHNGPAHVCFIKGWEDERMCVCDWGGVTWTVLAIIECVGGKRHKQSVAELSRPQRDVSLVDAKQWIRSHLN